MEDLMVVDFQVKHVSAKQNVIADYLSRLLSKTGNAPDYLRLLRTYKSSMGVVRVIEEENDQYDYDLLKQASEDIEYVALIAAIENKQSPLA